MSPGAGVTASSTALPGSFTFADIDAEAGRYDLAAGTSPRMHAIKRTLEQVAPTDATILVTGESGAGKELVARTLHQLSPRRDKAFVKVNCAALPADLLESELLGYERGAFTGAHRTKPGKFELANGGTIFLDEIGDMPVQLQAKILQVLQDREFSPLGSDRDIRVDTRVIAATNKDLRALVQRGEFRDDLYYRLNVMRIHVPPLRERREEIPALVSHFLETYTHRYARARRSVSDSTMRLFMEYAWPGNIRELENCVKRVVLLESEDWVPEELTRRPITVRPNGVGVDPVVPAPPVATPVPPPVPQGVWDSGAGLKEIARRAAKEAEGMALREVLDQVRWHRVEAARRLKVSYKTLLSKMKEHGLGAVTAALLLAHHIVG
jgi:two-component system response regulator AtoC